MELTIDQLMQGKATRIKDKEYFTTKAYVEPFLERMAPMTNDFIIQAKPADQVSLTPNGDINFEDVIYNRVWIQAVLPDEYAYDNHKRVISMLYALDARKPVVKLYTGALNMACLNLCVFDPDALSVAELEPESAINYSFVKNMQVMTDTIAANLRELDKIEYKKDTIFKDLGLWVDRCINAKWNSGFGSVKLAESAPVDVYKNLFYDQKSKYFTQDDRVDGFTVYNAFTDLITQDKKDLVNKFEKTLLVKEILGL